MIFPFRNLSTIAYETDKSKRKKKTERHNFKISDILLLFSNFLNLGNLEIDFSIFLKQRFVNQYFPSYIAFLEI